MILLVTLHAFALTLRGVACSLCRYMQVITLSKLHSTCPKEQVDEQFFLKKEFFFSDHFRTFGKNYSAGSSKLHSTSRKEHFENKNYFF